MSTYRDDDRARRELESARAEKARLLDRVRVAAPCSASWDEMVGSDRVRFCRLCAKNVYNVSAMTLSEAEDFLGATRGDDVCIRFYRRRSDGTVLTADCPVGIDDKRKREKRRLKVFGVCVAAACAAMTDLSLRDTICETDRAGWNTGVSAPIDADGGRQPSSQPVYK